MTDAELVHKKLAFIARCIHELRTVIEPEDIVRDLRSERFAEHTLQIAIQAAQDVAAHIVSDQRLPEPRTNRELFASIASAGWLPPSQVPILTQMVGFRNILVHGYVAVDPDIVRDVVENRLGDLEDFIEALRQRLTKD